MSKHDLRVVENACSGTYDTSMMTQPCYFCNAPINSNDAVCAVCQQPLLLRDRYRLLHVLGRGGFGIVYAALDQQHARPCAIKVVASSSLVEQRQVETEAQMLVQHAQHLSFVPSIYDLWHHQAQTYLVMEFIDGLSLDQLLDRPWPALEVEQFLRTLLGNLEQLHAVGIVHRDIKPDNIKRTAGGAYVLLDFGIAKQGTATRTSAKALSPDYASPEQFRGELTDARSDLYSLGATAYHLLIGAPPPRAISRAAGVAFTPIQQLAPGHPSALAHVLNIMLALDPEERPYDARAALLLLDREPAPKRIEDGSAGKPTIRIARQADDHVLEQVEPAGRFLLRSPVRTAVLMLVVLGVFAAGIRPLFVQPVEAPTSVEATVQPQPSASRIVVESRDLPEPRPPMPARRLGFEQVRIEDGRPLHEIFVATDTGQSRLFLAENRAPLQLSPRWSPDGQWLAYTSEASATIIRADGSKHRQYSVLGNFHEIAWAPGSNQIAATIADRRDLDIYIMDPTGDHERPITDTGINMSPSWSPDGTRIAFISRRNGGQNVYVMNADGSDLRRLTTTPLSQGVEIMPKWSPDGTRIAFASMRHPDGRVRPYHLYVIDADGRNERRITNPEQLEGSGSGKWSPDGTRIAFIGENHEGEYDVYWIDVDSTMLHRVTSSQGQERSPEWSPDGRRIAFIASLDQSGDIYIVDETGANLQRVTHTTEVETSVAWVP